jgi:hypothetical protein
MIKAIIIPVVLFVVLMPAPVSAFRPFITDDAGTVTPAAFELETSADYWHDKASFGLCFKHGVTERMDIGIAFGRCMLPEDESGYDLAELLLKFNFIPDRLSASFSGSFGDPCYSALLIYSQQISFFSIHTNLGYSAVGAEREGFLTYGLATVVEVNRFSFGPEFGGTHRSLDWWQFGLQVTLTEWLAIDAALGGNFECDVALNAASGLFFAFPLPRKEV